MQQKDGAKARGAHPALFLVLYLPFGFPGGFLVATLEYFYSQAHVSAAALGALVGLSIAPHTFKVAWAPLVDTTLNPKTWYLLALAMIVGGLAATGWLTPGPASMPALTLIVLFVSVAQTFAGMASESLMAHATPPQQRGAAGGWSQAGNVGGGALAGGAGLWVAVHAHSLMLASCLVAASAAVCGAALVFAPKVGRFAAAHGGYLATLREVGRDCLHVGWSRMGLLAFLVLLLPLGSNGAAGVFTAVAKDWRVTADLISGTAWMTGLLVIPLAIAGGYLADRIDRKTAYVLFGVVQGLIALVMALGPRSPEWFVVLAIAYSASTGLAYAGYAAVTLEAIGAGAAATKFNLFASVSNIPVAIMPALDGWAVTHWSSTGMLWLEAATAVGAASLYCLVALATRRRLVRVAPA